MSASEFPWYKSGLMAYSERTQSSRRFAENIIDNADKIGLGKSQSCVSIGVGTGDADIPLLRDHLPYLKKYIALDPNEENHAEFQRRFAELNRQDIDVSVLTSRVEDWPGPLAPVDLILVVEVLYHIPDRQELFTRCLQWLAPGGTMVVVHNLDQHCFVRIAEKYGVEDEMYTSKDIRKDFDVIGIKHYEESKVLVEFDIRDRDPDIMNFLMQKQLTPEEFRDLDTFLHECVPSGLENHGGWIFWVKKEDA